MRLASFNILHGACTHEGPVDTGALVRSAAALQADVLALQEVDRNQGRSHREDQAAAIAAGAAHRFAPALVGEVGRTRPATPADDDPASTAPAYGVAIVSRWPVRSWRIRHLPLRPPAGRGVRVRGRRLVQDDEARVLLAGVVDGPAGPFTVATTHLSLAPGWQEWQLALVLTALRGMPGPRFLLGDLNQPPLVVVPLAATAGWRSLAYVKTFPAQEPTRQIDYLLARPRPPRPVISVEARKTEVSDHRALVVDLQ